MLDGGREERRGKGERGKKGRSERMEGREEEKP